MNKNSFVALGYRFDHDNSTIVLTKKFAKAAGVVGSKEYNTLRKLRKDAPDYTVAVREIHRKEGKTNTHKNLTYKAMENHITLTIADQEQRETALRDLKAIQTLGKGQPCGAYLFVCDWFLKQYPNYAAVEVA